jgi:hypothetical protein
VQAFGPKHEPAEAVSKSTFARAAVLPAAVPINASADVIAAPSSVTRIEVSAQHAATVRVGAGPTAPPEPIPASAHADRLLESLAAILQADVTTLSRDHVLARVAERFPAAGAEPTVSRPAASASAARESMPQRIERREIVVVAQTNKVLRDLEAILSDQRDEVGSIESEPNEMIVYTQAEKVLATLLDVSSTRNAREDGSTRRIRKLDAARLRTPAGPPTTAAGWSVPTAATARATTIVDIDLNLPLIAEAVLVGASTDDAKDGPRDGKPAAAPVIVTAQPRPRFSPFGTRQVAVSETSLDRVRGGFVSDNLNISFGIERAVYINGALVTTTSLNVSDLGQITAGRGTTVFDSGTLALIQSGAGNTVAGGSISPTSIGTVVQNTLDGQKIQNVTVINATVNSLGVLRGLNLQSSLRGAVIDSLRR